MDGYMSGNRHSASGGISESEVVGFVGEQVFPGRQEHRGENGFGGFLRARIEPAGGLDGIAQKLYPVGFGRIGGKDIDDAASNTEFSGNFHHGNSSIAGPQQMAEQRFPLNHAAHFDGETRLRENGLGDQVL